MKNDAIELRSWVEANCDFSLPSFAELPEINLYMEQVVDYINKVLKPLNPYEKDLLTSFMVNNYVKARIIKMPVKKKYDKEHLGYLIFIASLKRTLTLNELSTLVEMDEQLEVDKPLLYDFYRLMSKDIVQDVSKFVKRKVDMLDEQYRKDLEAYDVETAKKKLLEGLSLTALRFSIKASVNQLMAEALIRQIQLIKGDDKSDDDYLNKKSKRRSRKIEASESVKIGAAKNKRRKVAKKSLKKAEEK